MKVAVWYDPQHGASVVVRLDGSAEPPDSARAPWAVPPGVLAQFYAKGSRPTWPQWAAHLEEAAPYGGQWNTEEVPDHLTMHQALEYARKNSVQQGLTPANP